MVTDHLGNEFKTVSDMCKYYNISIQTYSYRLNSKMSLEDALTTPIGKTFTDHMGNTFNSCIAMCNFWKVNYSVFKTKINNGVPLEIALTEKQDLTTYDHLGNKFESTNAMCKFYKIKPDTFRVRIKNGWSLEDALTKPTGSTKNKVYDHLGNGFPSVTKMLKFWNVSVESYTKGIQNNTPLKNILEAGKLDLTTYDHLGNKYATLKDMCKYYNIPYDTFRARIKKGMSTEDALTTPVRKISVKKEVCKDHLGNEFNSVGSMCKHYGLFLDTYLRRKKKGWSLKDILETPVEHVNKVQITDYLGNTHESIVAMCNYWNKSVKIVSNRLDHGYSVYEALSDNLLHKYSRDIQLTDDMHLIKCIQMPYFEICINNNVVILPKTDIINMVIEFEKSKYQKIAI